MENKRRQVPDRLTIDLYQPGMNMLAQAGLGGLAATLQSWSKGIDDGELERPENVEWQITDRSVTLIWGDEPGAAGRFFAVLYAYAFRIHEGLIDMPGTYEYGKMPKLELLAEMQRGLSNTILQFGPNRKTRSKETLIKMETIDDKSIEIKHQDLIGYTHQKSWESLSNKKGDLLNEVEVPGTIAPGFVQRHVVFTDSNIAVSPALAIAFHFAIVGTISLNLDGGAAVLVVPEVDDLNLFARKRYRLTPETVRSCQIKNTGEAAMESEVRCWSDSAAKKLKVSKFSVIEFRSPAWSTQQKTRTAVHEYDLGVSQLEFFNHILKMEEFQPRVATVKATKKNEQPRNFFAKSVVKPLLAENIATGQKWYRNFRSLIVSADGRPSEDMWHQLSFERKGLHKMAEDSDIRKYWTDRGEIAFVQAIHSAMRNRYREIFDEAGEDPVTSGNRIERQHQRWRIALANAKTQADFTRALSTIWSNGYYNQALQTNWKEILPLILDPNQWSLIRDLALFALASYQYKPRESADASATPATANQP